MFCFTVFMLLLLKTHTISGYNVVVKVKQGYLLGEKLETIFKDKTYISFKGIPYAHPPVGPLRFKAPRPPLPWQGIKNATEHGPKCPQVNVLTNGLEVGSENCLFLNVYTPEINSSSLLPVMFFIHGGLYKSLSGNVDYYGPDFFMYKAVVLVTINYRLGALGFLCLETKDVPGNAGLKDQLAALKWVKENIDKFGGNPNMVAIFGQSAGGSSVTYHIISPLSRGYFKRAIAMSGSVFNDWSIPYKPIRRAFALGKMLGYETRNKTDLFNFLQNITYDKLINKSPSVLASQYSNIPIKMTSFTPVYEKDFGQDVFLPAEPSVLLNAGIINDVDFMTGYTNQEALLILPKIVSTYLDLYDKYPEMLVPTKILIKSNPDTVLDIAEKIHNYYFGQKNFNLGTIKETVNYFSNESFAYDVQRFIRRLPYNTNKTRFLYKFSSTSKRNYFGSEGKKFGIYGASHLDDLLYLFHSQLLNLPIKKDSYEYMLVDVFTTLLTNFAKCGNPTPDSSLGFTWPPFNIKSLAYAKIGNTLTASTAPDEKQMMFWKSILNSVGIQF